jgi:hypothetical protein
MRQDRDDRRVKSALTFRVLPVARLIFMLRYQSCRASSSELPTPTLFILQFFQRFKSKQRERTRLVDTATIIAELEAERDRLERAIAVLQGNRTIARTASSEPNGRSGKRRLSAAARRKIGEAMKKRWAERRKKAVA